MQGRGKVLQKAVYVLNWQPIARIQGTVAALINIPGDPLVVFLLRILSTLYFVGLDEGRNISTRRHNSDSTELEVKMAIYYGPLIPLDL